MAAGTYTPGAAGDRAASFALKSGVAVYGGFAGTETARSQRDWTASVTTLSGDDSGFSNSSENSYHVVTVAGGGTLDGFTIAGGNADGDPNKGGGIFSGGASPMLHNLTVRGNAASDAGGGADTSAARTFTITIRNSTVYLPLVRGG